MSSDESRFCLRHLDRRVEVWRRRGEPCADCYTDRVASFGGGSVMVGDGISLSGKGRGLSSLEAISIQRDIKMRFCNQWQSHISTVWDQTLSSKMTTLTTRERGLSETTSRIWEWPACRPDLNPIEQLWDQPIFQTRISLLFVPSLYRSAPNEPSLL